MTDESTCMDFPHHIKGNVFVCSKDADVTDKLPAPKPLWFERI